MSLLLARRLRLTPRLGLRALAVQVFPVPEMGDSITEGTLLEYGTQATKLPSSRQKNFSPL